MIGVTVMVMRRRAAVLLALVSMLGALGCRARGAAPAAGGTAPLSVSHLLSGAPGEARARDGAPDDAGFARALAPRPFRFPEDDGPHPAFRSEWWYFTGVLRARAGLAGTRRFGYELTIFRRALAPPPAAASAASPARPSAWATREAFMADLAITDVDGAPSGPRFHAYERFARDGLALAGARAHPFAVWVEDWRMAGPEDAPGTLPIHLGARDADGAEIDLLVGLAEGPAGHGRGPIAQGDQGLSAKGPARGQASYYYSRTRLPTRGRIRLPGAPAGQSFEVSGSSWMDREWSTDSLAVGVRGWDWLGVHLSDGRDLMLYRLRDDADRATPESRVTLIAASGATQHWRADQFTLSAIEVWTSPHTGGRYPIALRLEVPGAGLRLDLRSMIDDQELRLAVNYWEGAVAVSGTSAGAAIDGEGYLELTGYGGRQSQR
jgi:predicted secreted hydrolase